MAKASIFSEGPQTLQQKKIIFNYSNEEKCIELKAFEYPSMSNTFEKEKDKRVEGVFYHFDDTNEILYMEKQVSSNLTEINAFIWKKNIEINIIFYSCRTRLKENKVELYKLVEKLK